VYRVALVDLKLPMFRPRSVSCQLISILILAGLFVCASAAKVDADAPVVHTKSGALRGVESRGAVESFLGVPYAAPPLGNLRWRPPQEATAWHGIREATHYSNPCAQLNNKHSSEDCLYLNVWTPAKTFSERLPVMVWIHGGGFLSGAGSDPKYDGTLLAKKGVVVVTINYRLGVFGFLAHPDLTKESPHHASGNYGLMDQLCALRWVQENIAKFGGDPHRVTVFGESAGATSIAYLLVSPLAKGLFQAAILESPSRVLLPDPELNKVTNGLTPMETVGTAIVPHIAEARTWSTVDVMQRAKAATDALYAPGGKGKLGLRPESQVHIPDAHDSPWWAFVDGWVIPQQLQTLYREGNAMPLPILAGTNADEGSVFLRSFPVETTEEYRDYLRLNYWPEGGAMLRLYPATSAASIKRAVDNIITDSLFLYGVRGIALAEEHKKEPVYLYRFARDSRDPKMVPLGAWHGAEVPYVFGTADPRLSPNMYDAQDHALSEEMMNAWINFAETGNPNVSDLPRWPAATAQDQNYMNFGDTPTFFRLMKQKNFAVFDRVFELRPAR
jgi:para-nitrobenzyl esterase